VFPVSPAAAGEAIVHLSFSHPSRSSADRRSAICGGCAELSASDRIQCEELDSTARRVTRLSQRLSPGARTIRSRTTWVVWPAENRHYQSADYRSSLGDTRVRRAGLRQPLDAFSRRRCIPLETWLPADIHKRWLQEHEPAPK